MRTPNLFTSNLAEISVSYNNKVKFSEMSKVTCSRDASDLLRRVWSNQIDHVEQFVVLCLNRANKVLGWSLVSSGGLAGTVADPKIIFQIALKSNASSVILAHNHPSGNTKPSEADIKLTKKLISAGSFLDLPVLDHVILTSEGYFSFADEGMIVEPMEERRAS